jgi:DNA-binding response OmpR family regulator
MATILIIDDDPDVLFAVRMCLEAAGHDVVEAANGTTAQIERQDHQ